MDDIWFCRSVQNAKESMFRLAWAILRNEADCEDAAQSAILKAYEHLPRLKDRDNFIPWLLRILQRECFNILKKRKGSLPLEEDQEPPVEDTHRDMDIVPLFSSLSPGERAAIVLYYYEDMSIRDIARLMDVREGTVKSWLSRGRSHLKVMMERKELTQ